QISEHIPPGYAQQPVLVCTETHDQMPPVKFVVVSINGTWNTQVGMPGTTITCDWYNWYLGDGEITVHKRLCPEGYDRHAWNADPMVDCTEKINGINFLLDQPDPGVDLQSMTGDSVDSAVYFG